MNFEFKTTFAYLAVKRARMPVFRFAKNLKDICLILFIIFIALLGFSFFNFFPGFSALRLAVLFLSFYFIFWDLDLFLNNEIKRPPASADISGAAENPENYNLAEFFDFEAMRIIKDSADFSIKKKIQANSACLLRSALNLGRDIDLICFRLGMDSKELQSGLKNYLEKTPREPSSDKPFSEDFEQVITEAIKISAEKKMSSAGVTEIFIAIAGANEFFKKTLVDFDLKFDDVENLSLWIDSVEKAQKRMKEFWSRESLLREGSLGNDWISGYTVTLDQFSIDWRKIVSKWDFKEIMCHQKEISEAELILAKPRLSNALIIGEPGTGRKSIVEAIAQKAFLGNTLPELKNKRVVELDLVKILSSIGNFEELENVLDRMFNEAVTAGNVILFINDLHNFIGQNQQKAGSTDISGILSKYLSLPGFQLLAITDYSGFHKNIEQSPTFAQLFSKVEVSEVTEPETLNILLNLSSGLENKYNIIILYPALREIVNLTARYMPSLPFPEKAINILEDSAVYVRNTREKALVPHHVSKIVSDKTGIPIGKMEVKEKETLLDLENLIHNRIVNQQEAVSEISIAMRRARMGIASKTRPMGTFLFLGPTGVGKTETAKALAQIYFGSEKKMIRLDMSEFQAIADIPRLVGAVSPVEMQGLLTTPVRETPFSLVLLDEIEKSHPDILNLFLQVLDEGHITDGQGRKVVFTNTIIICTSNAGADMIFKQVESGQALEKDKLFDSLFGKGIFRPEFVNRFDAAVIFHPLTKDNLMQIAQLSLQGLQKNLKEKEIDFNITEPLKEKIVELSYKPEFGAREMRRVIQDKVENAIAQALLSDKIAKGDKIEVNPETFEVIVNPVE